VYSSRKRQWNPRITPQKHRMSVLEGWSQRVAGWSSGVVTTKPRQKEYDCCLGLGYPQRIAGFAFSALSGLLCLTLCLGQLWMLPLGASRKFAMLYSLGNALLVSSSCFLVGPMRQLKNMTTKNRLTASIAYVSASFLTIYLSLAHFSVFLIIPSLLIQILAMMWYLLTYLPFGDSFLFLVSSLFRFPRTRSSVLPTWA